MKKIEKIILFLAFFCISTPIFAGNWEAELRGPFFTSFSTRGDKLRAFNPKLANRISGDNGGFAPGLVLSYDFRESTHQDGAYPVLYFRVQQDLCDRTAVTIGGKGRMRYLFSPDTFCDIEAGLGLGTETKYTYRYNNSPDDIFLPTQYIGPSIDLGAAIGTHIFGHPVSLRYSAAMSLTSITSIFGDFFGGLITDTDTYYAPSSMQFLSLQIGF